MLMEMVFGNLIDNAVKYGGIPPQVHVAAKAIAKDKIVVQIRDHGAGIPNDQRSKVFQLFFRGSDELQRTHRGTGLGLYIVRTLVGIMKGRIAITDPPDGDGTVFEVLLPGRLVPGTQSAQAENDAEREAEASGTVVSTFVTTHNDRTEV